MHITSRIFGGLVILVPSPLQIWGNLSPSPMIDTPVNHDATLCILNRKLWVWYSKYVVIYHVTARACVL